MDRRVLGVLSLAFHFLQAGQVLISSTPQASVSFEASPSNKALLWYDESGQRIVVDKTFMAPTLMDANGDVTQRLDEAYGKVSGTGSIVTKGLSFVGR